MPKSRRLSVAGTERPETPAPPPHRTRRSSLTPGCGNASSGLLRRHRKQEDEKRERRKKHRSKSANARKAKSKAKKKSKSQTPLPPISPQTRRALTYQQVRPDILVSYDSPEFSMSPVKRAVHVDPSKTHHDDKLNKSLENLGLTKSRPLLRLGDKPLFVIDTDGRHTVYKKVCISRSKSPYDEQSWFEFCMREYMFMRQLQGHPNIVEVETAFIDTDHLIINMEFTDRGDLFTILTDYRDDSGHALAFNEKKAKYVMRQILLGVSYMHSKNLAHRDLKLENILYFEKPIKAIKICDFEYTCNIEKDDVDILGMFLGSWTAISPELVLAAIAYNSDVNQLRTEFQQYKDGEPTVFAWDWRKSDIWACGVMLFTCLHGAFPYYGVDDNDNESLHAMHRDMFDKPLSVHSSISEPCREVLKAMLHLDHETRKTANEILEMEWFKGVGGLSRSGGSSVSLSGSGTLL